MIRIFVFVTGISLAQFSHHAGDPTIVLVETGYSHFTEFHGLHQPHTATMQEGSPRKTIPWSGDGPPVLELTAPCATNPCPAIKPPENIKIADLNELIRSYTRVKAACVDDPAAPLTPTALSTKLREQCVVSLPSHEPGAHDGDTYEQPLVNTFIRFNGGWNVTSTVDCYGTIEAPKGKLMLTNFVRPKAAWQVLKPFGQEIGNSLVFFADVPDELDETSVDSLLRINGNTIDLQVIDASTGDDVCSRLGGVGGPEKCVVITIRNKTEDSMYHGGGDPHFAALYSLLETRSNTDEPWHEVRLDDAWLPIALEAPVCKAGGGCCFLAGCVGGRVWNP